VSSLSNADGTTTLVNVNVDAPSDPNEQGSGSVDSAANLNGSSGSTTTAWTVLIVAGVIILGVICTYFLVKIFKAGATGEYVPGDRVMCHRTAESDRAEEGLVELVMPQRFTLCGNAPQYSVVFRDDGQRHRVAAVQMIEKLGHEERDVAEFSDNTSLAIVASSEARSLVDEIIEASTAAESRDHHIDVPNNSGGEETGGSLVESVLRTVDEMIEKDGLTQIAVPANMNHVESGEGYAEGAYDDRDKGYADEESGLAEIVEQTVRQVLDDRRTDEDVRENVMDANATQLVESVLRTMDDDIVENEMSIGQPTTSLVTQTLVDDLMDKLWTEEVTTDGSPERSSNTCDRSKKFVGDILDEITLEDSDSSSSSAEASDQSKEIVTDAPSLEGDGEHQSTVTPITQDFLSTILDEISAESSSDEGVETHPPKPPTN